MKKIIKKAFTLVELLVVIAILATLASVTVVGYNKFIDKAEISADQQAVTQMNLALQADSITDGLPQNTTEVASVLYENGYTGDFRNAHEEYDYVWLKDVNVVALMEDFVIVYPKQYEGRAFDKETTFYFNTGLPKAYTTKFSEEESEITEIFAAFDLLNGGITTNPDELATMVPLTLDAGMNFTAIDDEESLKECPYKDYYVDFVIRSNIDFNFKGFLWGQYDAIDENGVAVIVDGLPIEAGVSYNVLGPVFTSGFKYSEVVEYIKEFNCGIMVSDETKAENPGMEITLELYMYENMENGSYYGESFLVGRSYTYQIS